MPTATSAVLVACGLLSGALSTPAWALEIESSIQHTAEHTNNTGRTEDNPLAEWVNQPGINVAVTHDTANLTLDARYSYERRLYQEDLWEDENATTGRAELLWQMIPQRLDFSATNTLVESTQRAFAVDTQANRQIQSITALGPTLRLQPRSGDELQFEYRYIDVNARETDTDSQRHNWTSRYVLGLSANRSVTFEGTYSDIDYDNEFAPDGDNWTATVGYTQTSGNLDLTARAGYSEFDRDNRAEPVDGGIYDLALTWRASGVTSLSLTAGHNIQDQSSNLINATSFDDNVNEDTDLNEIFTETRGDLSITQTIGRSNITLRAYASKELYEDVNRDSERIGMVVNFNRNLSRRTTLSVSVDYANRKFREFGEEQDELRARFDVRHQLGRRLDFSWGARYEDRDAERGESYDELIGMLRLSYTILGGQG